MIARMDRAALATAARAEHARRKAAWERDRDQAIDADRRRAIVNRANADLLVWQDIVRWVETHGTPADPEGCARAARRTLERMKTADPQDMRIVGLWQIARALEAAVIWRGGTPADNQERQAA